jgi:transcriptional regulator with XRE-family HTH domain
MPHAQDIEQHVEAESLGGLLRYWRRQRSMSQLDLSLDAGVSQRHLSFVESGRSVPSRELVLRLSEKLDVPFRERNTLLLASGYAPVYQQPALDDPEMALVVKAVDRVLRQQEPHPALVLDRYWNVIKTNEAAPRFFGSFIDLSTRPKPRNLLHLLLDPDGLRPFIENWEQVAAGLLQRVYRESAGHVVDAKTRELLDALYRYPGVRTLKPGHATPGPVWPVTFVKGSERSSYFSLVTTVGVPQSVTAQELRIECMFPVETA